MKHLLAILTILLLPLVSQAQHDTLRLRTTPLLGSAMLSSATLVSLRPELHGYEQALHRDLGLASLQRMPFDNVLQFVPLAAPMALNIIGLESEHSLGQIALLSATASLIGLAAVESAKLFFHVERPDGSAYTSFPSGHTFMAFAGADILRREYGRRYPWLPYVGYGVAALVGAMRVYNSRHWPSDVLAGAGVALLSVSFTYWLYNK